MLTETNKERLVGAVQDTISMNGGLGSLPSEGPEVIIDGIIDAAAEYGADNHPEVLNLKENRKEAEQIVAGLLGMM